MEPKKSFHVTSNENHKVCEAVMLSKLKKKKVWKNKISFQKLSKAHSKRKCHLTCFFFAYFHLSYSCWPMSKANHPFLVRFFYYVREFLEMFLVLSIKHLLNFCLILFFFILTITFCLSHQQTNTMDNQKIRGKQNPRLFFSENF